VCLCDLPVRVALSVDAALVTTLRLYIGMEVLQITTFYKYFRESSCMQVVFVCKRFLFITGVSLSFYKLSSVVKLSD